MDRYLSTFKGIILCYSSFKLFTYIIPYYKCPILISSFIYSIVVSVISRHFLSKLILVLLAWHQPVSRNSNPSTLSTKEGSHYYHNWYDPVGDRTRDIPHPRRKLYHFINEGVCFIYITHSLEFIPTLDQNSPILAVTHHLSDLNTDISYILK